MARTWSKHARRKQRCPRHLRGVRDRDELADEEEDDAVGDEDDDDDEDDDEARGRSPWTSQVHRTATKKQAKKTFPAHDEPSASAREVVVARRQAATPFQWLPSVPKGRHGGHEAPATVPP